ncbi:hypothetical protein OIV19_21485 [Brucella sp. HL-2]|nr:hypothetical protein [Brucella sp. HL-2]MCV9910171.1 hypothetical protein [Brucella sp. HL-2]
MAKRYGRNQRRKHREQIEVLESTLRAKDDVHRKKILQVVRELGDTISLIVAWDNDVREMLGDYSAFLIETGRIKHGKVFDAFFKVRLSPVVPETPSPIDLVALHDRVTTLRNLIEIEELRYDLQHLVRFQQVDKNGNTFLHLCYGLPQRELRRMYERDYVQLAEHIAHEFRSYIENPPANSHSNYREFRP